MSLALGIDLGTTNSVAAVATPMGVEIMLGPRGERVQPSAVAMPAAGGVLVGTEARLARLAEPEAVILSAKRFIGQNLRSLPVQAATSLKFFEWAYKQGDKTAGDLDYVPMPESVKQIIYKSWNDIKDTAGKSVAAH